MSEMIAERCPRCQQEEAGTALFQCSECKQYCCRKCVGGPPHHGGWGVAYSCPACKEGMTNEYVVGVVRKLTAEEAHLQWLSSLSFEERQVHDLVSGTGDTCDLQPHQYRYLPQLAEKRGASLQMLILRGATDADLRALAAHEPQFPVLWRVMIEESPNVTDEGLRALSGLSGLTVLNLDGMVGKGQPWPITLEGVAALKQALPKCAVTGGPKKPWWKFW